MRLNRIERTSCIRRNRALISSQINQETVLFDDERGAYFGMNKVGSKIWSFLEEPQTIEQVFQKLLAVYHVTEDEFNQDVMPFLNELMNKGMIEDASNARV